MNSIDISDLGIRDEKFASVASSTLSRGTERDFEETNRS